MYVKSVLHSYNLAASALGSLSTRRSTRMELLFPSLSLATSLDDIDTRRCKRPERVHGRTRTSLWRKNLEEVTPKIYVREKPNTSILFWDNGRKSRSSIPDGKCTVWCDLIRWGETRRGSGLGGAINTEHFVGNSFPIPSLYFKWREDALYGKEYRHVWEWESRR